MRVPEKLAKGVVFNCKMCGQCTLHFTGMNCPKSLSTIADLAGSEGIQSPHLAEALQYRPKIMMG